MEIEDYYWLLFNLFGIAKWQNVTIEKKGIEDSYVIHKGTILKNFKNHKEQHKNGQRDFFDDSYVMLKVGKSTINR